MIKTPPISGKLLTVNDVADLLAVSPKTIRKYIWERTIPYLKINGHIRFEQSQLDEWLDEKRVPTLDEIQFGKPSSSKKKRRVS